MGSVIAGRWRLVLSTALTLLAGPVAAQVGPLVAVSPGRSPFANCTADDVPLQEAVCAAVGAPCTYYPNTEIEPWVDANPTNPQNLIAGWQQDRWSNGGSRGNVSAFSKDGGRTWRKVILPGGSLCGGGVWTRNSDPWVSFAPNGTAYFNTLAFQPDRSDGGLGANAVLVHRSTDGGASWSAPTTLIIDTNGQIFNDKNSLTADPTDARYAYAVWDRLQDFTLPEAAAEGVAAPGAASFDGVSLARERVHRLKAKARAEGTAGTAPEAAPEASVVFKGPTWLARTTDGGSSWEPAKLIYDPGANAQTINNLIEVLPDGTLVNFFTHIFANGDLRIDLLRSTDKGVTFQKPPKFVDFIDTVGVVTPDKQEPVRDASILFDTAVDPTSGALYVVWQDARFRGVDEIAFAQSTDGGRTWSAPIRINRTPYNRNPLRKQAFIPSVEVGPGSRLVVTYYDFRNDTARAELTDYWAITCERNCASRGSWRDEVRLTPSSFNMLNAPFAGGLFLGDYMGLVAAGRVVHPVWGIATAPDVTSEFTRRLRY